MALSAFNWILLVLSFVTAIPGSALLWRVYDGVDASVIHNPLQRQAQYESCSFIFYFIINLITLLVANKGQATSILRTLSIGILFYTTVYGDYVNFTNLNNLRIVEMSSDKVYSIPTNGNAVDTVNARKLLGGLILGYFSLFFGLLSTVSGEVKFPSGKISVLFWILALILAIPGVVVSWSNSSAPTYSSPYDYTHLQVQTALFAITTTILVQWIVLSLGLLNGAEDLLAASAFIFGVLGLYFPVLYFFMQSQEPDDTDYIWAGPILCWIASGSAAVSAVLAQSSKKEATV